jgi:hypothetical protein
LVLKKGAAMLDTREQQNETEFLVFDDEPSEEELEVCTALKLCFTFVCRLPSKQQNDATENAG